jgi:hypothetical protein
VLTSFEAGILGQGALLVSSSVSLPHLYVIFHCKTLLYRNLNQNCNILYSDHLIYGLYVCTCVCLLQQKSFNMILVKNPSFYDGVLHSPPRRRAQLFRRRFPPHLATPCRSASSIKMPPRSFNPPLKPPF